MKSGGNSFNYSAENQPTRLAHFVLFKHFAYVLSGRRGPPLAMPLLWPVHGKRTTSWLDEPIISSFKWCNIANIHEASSTSARRALFER